MGKPDEPSHNLWSLGAAPRTSFAAAYATDTTRAVGAKYSYSVRHAESDSDDDDDRQLAQGSASTLAIPTVDELRQTIKQLADDTDSLTVARFATVCKSVADVIHKTPVTDATAIGEVCLVVNELFNTIAKRKDAKKHLAPRIEDQTVLDFLIENIQSNDTKASPSITSRKAESRRTKLAPYAQTRKRSLMATSAIALQRCCANAFVSLLCDKTEASGGTCVCFYEKHRGDETPFAKVSAHDDFADESNMKTSDAPAIADADAPADELAINKPDATLAQREAGPSIRVHTVAANLKVYSSDLEIGALFCYPTAELLCTFKLICPLARLDRCKASTYHEMHLRQYSLLPARKRFLRIQRLHCSDGDGALNLAERHLADTLRRYDPTYSVPTLRSKCVVHRCYHAITHGMSFVENFLAGQIRLALSLKGPWGLYKVQDCLLGVAPGPS